MRRACIDIGSNTTRLLVAECGAGGLQEVHQEKVFTRVSRSLRSSGMISAEKIAEVAEVVAAQLDQARSLGAVEVHAVATAAIRRASNGPRLVSAVRDLCGLEVEILSGDREARLAFIGAARTLDHDPVGVLGVVDVGGGSSELVVGSAPDTVTWWRSLEIGSGDLAEDFLCSDPPSAHQLSRARAHVVGEMAGLQVPRPAEAVAVGGSAASLRRLAGPFLDAAGFRRSLALLATERAGEIARRFTLERERVRLLPAGLLILQVASELFEATLQIGWGGLREGVLLEAER